MHERERVYYLTLTNDTSLRVEFVKVDILDKWLVLMYIIYATTKRFNCVFRAQRLLAAMFLDNL